MQLPARKIKSAFRRKGFEEKNSHHLLLIYKSLSGKKYGVRTYMSHSAKSIDDKLISEMSTQTLLTKKQFVEFVECTISQEDYEKIISEKLDKQSNKL